jgi:hypothetical protein
MSSTRISFSAGFERTPGILDKVPPFGRDVVAVEAAMVV